MISTSGIPEKAPTASEENASEKAFLFRFQGPVHPKQKKTTANLKAPASSRPKRFDWLMVILCILFALGALTFIGILYAVLNTPTVLPR